MNAKAFSRMTGNYTPMRTKEMEANVKNIDLKPELKKSWLLTKGTQ